jgi:hypothetical protein
MSYGLRVLRKGPDAGSRRRFRKRNAKLLFFSLISSKMPEKSRRIQKIMSEIFIYRRKGLILHFEK